MSNIERQVIEALRTVNDPDLHRNIVDLGFVKDLGIKAGRVSFTLELTAPACPVKEEMERWAREAVLGVEGVTEVDVRMTAAAPGRMQSPDKPAVQGVRNIIAVGSGKGGVGKTTITVNLAVALARSGAKVGLLDADVYGPNVPLMLGVDGKPAVAGNRIQPLLKYGVKVMSMGFLVDADTPVIWRGPMLHSVIQQFVRQVEWGELDYLLVDLPPGTGDVQLTLTQSVPLMGAVVVSTPQDVALQDARKAIMMFRQVKVEVLGLVENMSYFECPHCRSRAEIFNCGGGEKTAQKFNVPFLGGIPLDAAIRLGGDEGKPIVVGAPDSPVARAFVGIAESMAAQVSIASAAGSGPVMIE